MNDNDLDENDSSDVDEKLEVETPCNIKSENESSDLNTDESYDDEHGDDYFDDDQFLSEDSVLELSKDSALFQQHENVVSWHLDNFYKEDGTRRNKYSLVTDPPIFRIESPDGQSAEFLVTKNLALTLGELFSNVNRGFNGLDGKKSSLEDDSKQTTTEKMFNSIKENPARALVTMAAMGIVVVAVFLSIVN